MGSKLGDLPPVPKGGGEAFIYLRIYHERRDYAVRLARHYLRHSFNSKYTTDQDAEMECFVDAVIDAAVARALRALEAHEVEGHDEEVSDG